MCKTGGKGRDGASETVKIKYWVALGKRWTRNGHFSCPFLNVENICFLLLYWKSLWLQVWKSFHSPNKLNKYVNWFAQGRGDLGPFSLLLTPPQPQLSYKNGSLFSFLCPVFNVYSGPLSHPPWIFPTIRRRWTNFLLPSSSYYLELDKLICPRCTLLDSSFPKLQFFMGTATFASKNSSIVQLSPQNIDQWFLAFCWVIDSFENLINVIKFPGVGGVQILKEFR